MTTTRNYALLIVALGLSACTGNAPEQTYFPDVNPQPRAAHFEVAIDTTSAELAGATAEPVAGPVTITGDGGDLGLAVRVWRPAATPDWLRAELFVDNRDPSLGLAAARLHVSDLAGATAAVDVTRDPFADAPLADGEVALGTIGAEAVGTAALAFDGAGGTITFAIDVDATTTSRTPSASGPIAISPDGSEVWATFADAGLVAVIDTTTDTRVAQVDVPGAPSSVAITPDGALVLVTSRTANTVTVIDRARRRVVQTLGEADGIGREPRHVIASADGSWAYVSAYVGDRITRLARYGSRFEVDGMLDVGRRPAGMALAPDGTLLVAHFLPRGGIRDNHSWLTVITPDPFAVARETIIADDFDVADVQCLADVFHADAETLTFEGVATQLSGVYLSPGGSTAWVPGARVTGTPVLERGPNAMESAFANAAPGHFSPAFLFAFDARDPADTDRLLHPGVLAAPDVNVDYARCAQFQLEIEMAGRIVLGDGRQTNLGPVIQAGTAGMSETGIMRALAFSRGGRRLFGLSYLADELVVYDAMTAYPTSQLNLQLSGSNPIGMVVTPGGDKAYVAYANSTFVSVLDTSALARPDDLPGPSYIPYQLTHVDGFGPSQSPLTRLNLVRYVDGVPERPPITEAGQVDLVDADPIDPDTRRGRILFNSSNPDKYPGLSASRQAACATCHPDGGNDGSAWATMEGERRTISLRGGVAGRGWLHASGTHQNILEFVDTVVAERLGGSGGDDITLPLARYVATGIPRLQSPPVDEALAERGRQLFADHCSVCHGGAGMTSGNPDPDDPWGGGKDAGPGLFDVGTATDNAGVLLGPAFASQLPPIDAELFTLLRGDRALGPDDRAGKILDFRPRPDRPRGQFKAPSLIGDWDSVLFFHDGRYTSLDQVVDHLNRDQELGLSADDQHAVVEYLKTL